MSTERRGAGVCLVLAASVLTGCNQPPAAARTGVEEVVRKYYDALLHQDWPQAYATLHPDSRARCSADEFARLAQRYCRGLGFDPEEARVRSCEEQGERAIAHVLLTGHTGSTGRQYKDTLVLRQGPEGWGVVLPRSLTR